MNQQNLQTDSRVKHRLLLSHGIKWGLIHFPPCVSLPSDRTFCCAMLMFSALWQDAICHSNELLCGRKKKKDPREHSSRCQGAENVKCATQLIQVGLPCRHEACL